MFCEKCKNGRWSDWDDFGSSHFKCDFDLRTTDRIRCGRFNKEFLTERIAQMGFKEWLKRI